MSSKGKKTNTTLDIAKSPIKTKPMTLWKILGKLKLNCNSNRRHSIYKSDLFRETSLSTLFVHPVSLDPTHRRLKPTMLLSST